MMAVRTMAIDEAIGATPTPQLVILGAGLDGRAWRLPQLHASVVFEVDHPDTQRVKQARAAALEPTASAVHFVAVDFAKDSLDAALTAAGHDPQQPTTWVWEGVVMYLKPREVEATLQVIERRSAPASRLIVVYMTRAWMMLVAGVVLRFIGEPFRSAFSPRRMRALLARHGFHTLRDDDIVTLARALAPSAANEIRVVKHLRIATADRAPASRSSA